MLVKFIKENKTAWDEFLDTCTFAYNTAEHESTKFSPFELMYGQFEGADEAITHNDKLGENNTHSSSSCFNI